MGYTNPHPRTEISAGIACPSCQWPLVLDVDAPDGRSYRCATGGHFFSPESLPLKDSGMLVEALKKARQVWEERAIQLERMAGDLRRARKESLAADFESDVAALRVRVDVLARTLRRAAG